MASANRSRWMLVASMTIFGTIGMFVRNIPIPSGELALCRAVMASIILAGYLLVTRQPIVFSAIKKELPLLLISGLALGVNWILLFEAYKYTTVSTATLSYYFAPVIVTALCPLIFRERLTKKQALCFTMSTLGIVMITGVEGFSGSGEMPGILFGLSAAVFYAAVILLNKFIKTTDAVHRTFLQFLAAVVTLLPYVALSGGFHSQALDAGGWINLLIVGSVHTGVAYCLYFASLKELPGQTAAILSYIDPLVAVIMSVTVLGEPMGLWQLLGGALILGFTLLNELSLPKN